MKLKQKFQAVSAVALKDMVKRFGSFTAVHRMSLDIPEGTLTSRLARARQALRRETGRDGGPGDRMEVVR